VCLAIPMRIETINGQEAQVEVGGAHGVRTVSLALTPEARPGDYVVVHAGYAISVIDEAEAQETLRLLAELETFYTDEMIARELRG